MPVGARPSIEEIRAGNSTWYSSAEKKYGGCGGMVGWGLALLRVILGPDGLGADITQARLNTFSMRIALPTGLKCAHQHYPERGRTRSQSVHI
jgi:hypothetical protein